MSRLLQGLRILVTRPAAQSAPLARAIAERGGEALCFPLIEIGPIADLQPLQQAAARLDQYDVAIFISPNAVSFSLPTLRASGDWPGRLQVAAVGPGTAACLTAEGIFNVIVPETRFDSEAMLELPVFDPGQIAGQQVLILRGNDGRELLTESLRARGAIVDAISCYTRTPPADGAPVLSLLRNNRLDALTISSSEGLRNLLALLDTEATSRLRVMPLFVPHRRIAELAVGLGLQRVILTAPADAGIIEGLCAYNWLHHERNS